MIVGAASTGPSPPVPLAVRDSVCFAVGCALLVDPFFAVEDSLCFEQPAAVSAASIITVVTCRTGFMCLPPLVAAAFSRPAYVAGVMRKRTATYGAAGRSL